MLVVCSDIHILGSPLMKVVVTKMQYSAYEFSNIFRGWYPWTSTAGRGDPLPHQPQPGLWPDAGRKRPGVGTQTSVPLNFSAVVALLQSPQAISTSTSINFSLRAFYVLYYLFLPTHISSTFKHQLKSISLDLLLTPNHPALLPHAVLCSWQ